MTKTENSGFLGRRHSLWLRKSAFAAMACGGIFSSAHAASDISSTLIRTCSNQLNGSIYGDAVLNDFRNSRFPSPKTGGFKITSVQQVWLALPSYCLIKGAIQPTSPGGIDPAVKAPDYRIPDINYQIYIPSQWNGKFVQLGGGGFAWSSDVVAAGQQSNQQFSPSIQGSALANYAVVLSDAGAGESSKAFDPQFVRPGRQLSDVPKQEAVKNFGQDSIKKSLDVGLYLVKKLTGIAPSDTYFVGISTGGRQALKAIANWPDAYDGVVAGAPPVDETNLLKTLEVPAVVNDWVVNWNSGAAMLTSLFGGDVSEQTLSDGLGATSRHLANVAIESGANYDGYSKLLDELAPVWNVKPGDLANFFNAASNQKKAGKKGKKIIIYQGTSDFLVPCTQAGAFVSKLTQKAIADEVNNSVRAYFIENYSHGFYNTNSLLNRLGLSPLQLNWNAVSDLDKWVHDDNAPAGAPSLARNASGGIPADQALSAWGCLAASH
ncbi:pimeloyl-ACP methyl ester carboxylesterase [Variovorax boronicumulans]|uniref:tannase/feruloyl esterase family alpha/beta hydrolase n=1 Tax=Variovorax boronicumulans TaxID=436515 RepID=UPI002784D479|nr:tannase/feruloyl esterase family alpha/beta hydrolase [Variovorax boronicumulans]MDP9991253.1 pimeloyl-ACP methyl ester carboxylesterase [Variovorax boronicumulans]MDQ0003383.1 pimeloyl-ACP methyl ester carboxylesterase [Variovorax boronicumulans]